MTENVRELSRVITKLWDHSDLIQTTKTWLASKRTELSLVADDDNDKVEDMEQALKVEERPRKYTLTCIVI